MSEGILPLENTPRLHDILDIEKIENIREAFTQNETLRPQQLRTLLNSYGVSFNETQFEHLFLRINTNRDNLCDWDEFISHLLNGFRNDDPIGQSESLHLPIESRPMLRKAIHKYPIVKIRFCPAMRPDRTVDNTNGSYLTTSKDGTVIYWTQDFEFLRSTKSTNPNLKVSKTWVLDCIPLPDVRIVCTSSIERDLRFYDTTANNFHPRIIISRMPYEVTCMAYWFGETEDSDCRLILGDAGGNLALLEFCPVLRGPFQSKTGTALLQMTWADLVHGKLHRMRVTQLPRVHKDVVRQVEYSVALNAILSAAECRNIGQGRTPAPGLVISDLGVQKTQTIFRMTKGVSCFAFDRSNTIIATGGPDCLLRLWSHLMPGKPRAILPGHRSCIVFICLQDEALRIYTIDRDRIVKVWDTVEETLIQTYIAFGTTIRERLAITAFYNDHTRELVLGSMKLATVKCCPLLKLDKTDGYTHSRQVSVVLYNDLFKSIVTCGFDSYIIVWDPWTGRRQILIKQAHTRMSHGEVLRLEVTAACFDPMQQLLLTGARDGTMKVWNFNSGVCVRNLNIEPGNEITSLFWFHERILAVGWNKHVTEFSDTVENELGKGKCWDVFHSEDILASAARSPQTLATSSYDGELVLWILETGQPYRRIDVENPETNIRIRYDGHTYKIARASKLDKSKTRSMSYMRRMYRSKSDISYANRVDKDMPTIYRAGQNRSKSEGRSRTLSVVQLPTQVSLLRKTSVHAMLFLQSRPMDCRHGTLLVSLSTGMIQVFGHHPRAKGYIDAFNAIHMAGDVVITMTTDRNNRFLMTGSSLGYLKTWLICNYCVPPEKLQHINMPKLRVQFPFLIADKWMGRAKRSAFGQPNPMLVNSFMAHTNALTCLIYLESPKLLMSASSDRSVRIWTLGGQYVGTLGSPVRWPALNPLQPPPPDYPHRLPPDIRRVASSTTLKVLQAGLTDDPMAALLVAQRRRARQLEIEVRPGEALKVYGRSLVEPILGSDLQLPTAAEIRPDRQLDSGLPYVPVYRHLKYLPAEIVQMPRKPLEMIRCREELQKSGTLCPLLIDSADEESDAAIS